MVQTTKSRSLAESIDSELFKALCDPTRVALVACLARCCGPASVSQVATCCDVDLSVVSRHLAILADAGVVEAQREGRQVFYTLRYEHLATTLRALASAIDAASPTDRPSKSRCNCVRCIAGRCC